MKPKKSAAAVVVERVPDVELTMKLMNAVTELQERAYVLMALLQTVREFMSQQGRPPLRTVADSHGQRCARKEVCDELEAELSALFISTAEKRSALQELLMPGSTFKDRPLFSSSKD